MEFRYNDKGGIDVYEKGNKEGMILTMADEIAEENKEEIASEKKTRKEERNRINERIRKIKELAKEKS